MCSKAACGRPASSVRVTGQMIDASTGAHIWAERYDRRSDDIFALQDEIALSAVGAIAPSLRRAEIERVKRKRPDSLDAYDLVLRAQPDVNSGMPEQVMRALALLDRAIELDPAYALAHGNAAMCHHCLFLRAGLQEAQPCRFDPPRSICHHLWAGRCARTDAGRIFDRHGRA